MTTQSSERTWKEFCEVSESKMESFLDEMRRQAAIELLLDKLDTTYRELKFLLRFTEVKKIASRSPCPNLERGDRGSEYKTVKKRTDGGESEINQTRFEETREWLDLLSQETRANIVQNILGHRYMMPSLYEFAYLNPSKNKGTIKGHLDKLVETDFILRVTLPQGKRQRDHPDTFYILSNEGYRFLQRHSLLIPDIDEIRSDHSRVKRSDKFKKYEYAPRPTIPLEYDHPLHSDNEKVVDPAEFASGYTQDKNDGPPDDPDQKVKKTD